MTLAKALANGVPMGAMMATAEAAKGFEAGSHGSTFGGTPLAAAAAFETLGLISTPQFLDSVNQKSAYFIEKLEGLRARHPRIQEVRGKGLLLGLVLDEKAGDIVEECFKKGFIINGIQDNVLRFAPPLIVEQSDMDRLVSVLDSLFA